MPEVEGALAVLIDFENLALGLKGKRQKKFDIQKILERLVEKGKIVVKKAYADWTSYEGYKATFHEAAIELMEIPKRGMVGKNSADIRLAVDAIDLCYSKEHIDTFVIVSSDSDFVSLVSKLRAAGKTVMGAGLKATAPRTLVISCDRYFYLDQPTYIVKRSK